MGNRRPPGSFTTIGTCGVLPNDSAVRNQACDREEGLRDFIRKFLKLAIQELTCQPSAIQNYLVFVTASEPRLVGSSKLQGTRVQFLGTLFSVTIRSAQSRRDEHHKRVRRPSIVLMRTQI